MPIKTPKKFFWYSMALTGLLLSFGCYPKLPYSEVEIESFRKENYGAELFFETRAGKQRVFYIFPENHPSDFPEFLVIIYPGIGSKALDWKEFAIGSRNPKNGFLLIDYPGRGNNQGSMRPKYLPDSTIGALNALKKYLAIEQDQNVSNHLLLVGHSFGCAAALQVAQHLNPDKIVLIAPFTTLRKALFKKVGPLAWLNPDQMDNGKWLENLCKQANPPLINIIHGTKDQIVPFGMGKELANRSNGSVIFHEIEGAGHVDIIKIAEDLIIKALFDEEGTSSGLIPRSAS
jgi:uncharacterized protein